MRIQQGLPGDKRSKLKSPGSKVQVLYTCTGQWVPRTIGNYGCGNTRENNSVQDNSDMGTIGAIVLTNKGRVTMQQRTMGKMWEVNCLEKEMKVPRWAPNRVFMTQGMV